MPQDVVIRCASPDDEKAVVELWKACNLVVAYNDPAHDFRFALGKPASDILVGLNDNKIVGSVLVGHDGHRGWLYYVAAHPDFQKQGIGRQMVAAAENWLRERGVVKSMLLVRDTNTQVVEFYQHIGYESSLRVVMGKWL